MDLRRKEKEVKLLIKTKVYFCTAIGFQIPCMTRIVLNSLIFTSGMVLVESTIELLRLIFSSLFCQ